MKTLFVIGNGFDCYAHEMPTMYLDFKKFLIKKFPEYDEDFDGILSSTMMPDGAEEYDMDAVVGSIIRLLNECAGEEWSILESSLGVTYANSITDNNVWNFSEIDWMADGDKNDKEIRHSIYNNEDMSNNITGVYLKLNEFFEEWVFEILGHIDYSNFKKIKKPSFKNSLFLNFNYTRTLENLYNIKKNNICHIHGDAENSNTKIYFGHGDTEKLDISDRYFGAQDAFDSLIDSMKKDTLSAILNNNSFFKRLCRIKKIYSFGFSFSEVDMVYIEEITKHINPRKTRWYFNQYDWKENTDYIKKVKTLGFKVRKSHRW